MTMGALADRVGRRRLLLLGGGAYGVLSLLAALSTTPQMLVAARMLLGVAGATLMPSTLSLIRSMFADARQRSTALGVWTASFALGGVIGPVVGGLLLGAFWWGSVFVVAVPGHAAARGARSAPAARVPRRGRGTRRPAQRRALRRRRAPGRVRRHPARRVRRRRCSRWSRWSSGSAAGVGFLTRQRRHPTFGLELFRRRTFALPVATNAIAFFVLYGMQFLLAQYLQLGARALAARGGPLDDPVGPRLPGSGRWPRRASPHRLRPGAALGASLAVSAPGSPSLCPSRTAGGCRSTWWGR